MTDTRSSPLDNLKPLAGRALERALAHVLSLDPDTQTSLRKLDGRRITLSLQAPAVALALTVVDGGLKVGPAQHEPEPDLAVKATLAGLLAQLPFARGGATAPGRIKLAGDAELARELQQLAQRFDPDWDKPFADVFGEVLGVQIARVLREGLRAGLAHAKTLARDSAEYLTEESRDIASKMELDSFHDDVDNVRDQVDRIAARIERLQASVPEANE
ncbi:MAG: SCP2 sterol-binding domain-containing protein [Xanthomonadales bacterium]|nr:SCP2 sterol-binding domain-containing protein [Xanthomonadales bacterium]MDZ4117533.1 SCP2 sterol-binding domain-containing protein [Xanthomonadaceae bacterium]